MKKLLLTLIAFISFSFCYSQYDLNDYKYVIVSKQFHFQEQPNEFNLNQLAKFLFKSHGFETLIEGEPYPEDLKRNNCLALKSDITSKGTFKTKSVITLHDCNGEMVYKSNEGTTKEKEYKKAFNISIRKAFESFNGINYKYVPNSKYESDEVISEKKEIEKLKTEIKELKEEKVTIEKPQEIEEVKEVKKIVNQYDDELVAKEIFNGYKLIDTKSKEVMIIFDSGVKDVFIVKGKDAIIYKKDTAWIYSETNETNLLAKVIKIKF